MGSSRVKRRLKNRVEREGVKEKASVEDLGLAGNSKRESGTFTFCSLAGWEELAGTWRAKKWKRKRLA